MCISRFFSFRFLLLSVCNMVRLHVVTACQSAIYNNNNSIKTKKVCKKIEYLFLMCRFCSREFFFQLFFLCFFFCFLLSHWMLSASYKCRNCVEYVSIYLVVYFNGIFDTQSFRSHTHTTHIYKVPLSHIGCGAKYMYSMTTSWWSGVVELLLVSIYFLLRWCLLFNLFIYLIFNRNLFRCLQCRVVSAIATLKASKQFRHRMENTSGWKNFRNNFKN